MNVCLCAYITVDTNPNNISTKIRESKLGDKRPCTSVGKQSHVPCNATSTVLSCLDNQYVEWHRTLPTSAFTCSFVNIPKTFRLTLAFIIITTKESLEKRITKYIFILLHVLNTGLRITTSLSDKISFFQATLIII